MGNYKQRATGSSCTVKSGIHRDHSVFCLRLTILLDLVLYTDTLYFRLEYICCMDTGLSSGFFFHFSGAVRIIEIDFSSGIRVTPGGPICAKRGGEKG